MYRRTAAATMTCPLRAACSCTAELTPLALARRAHGEGANQVTQARSLLGLGLAARLGLARRLGRHLLDDLLLGLLLRGGGNQVTSARP